MAKKHGILTGFRLSNLRGRQNRIRLAKFIIFIGFIVVGIVFFSVFIPRAGLNIEIIDRTEVVGTMEIVSVKISNNNFAPLNDVVIRFGENGTNQPIGNLGPFASVMITPEEGNLNFDKVIINANNGTSEYIKSR